MEILKTMPRGLLAGSTDYSHQTFRDILDDLNNWKTSLISTTETISTIVKHLQDNGYWSRVPDDFSSLVMYALKFYETSITEISGIIQDLETEVQENHISRLRSLAKTADDLNIDFGRVWHREYKPKDYGEPNFSNVEKIYALGRDMVVDMLDLSNAAARLEDYLGMKSGTSGKQQDSKKYIAPILLFLLGIIISIATNVASSVLPSSLQPYYWLSWPLLAILTVASIILLVKQ
jgi:hypothetical protein